MYVPKLSEFDNLIDFFKAFVEINKKEVAPFSYEYFAKKLGWPKSVLSDIISGRRPLSIRRALQFAEYFNLCTIDSEILLFWTIRNVTQDTDLPKNLRDLYSNELRNQIDTTPSKLDKVEKCNALFPAIYYFLLHTKKFVSTEHIYENLKYVNGLTLDGIEENLEIMFQTGFLEKRDDDTIKINYYPMVNFTHNKKFQKKDDKVQSPTPRVAESFNSAIKFLSNPGENCQSYSCFSLVRVKKSELKDIFAKISHTTKWLGQQDCTDDKSNYEDYEIMQMSTCIFPLLDPDYKLPNSVDS